MKGISIILLALVLGCHSRRLEITQLKFGDFERVAIEKNEVDTTYLIAKNPWVKQKYGELVFDTVSFLNWKFMDVGFVVYDSLGRIVVDKSIQGGDYKYFYDTLGILDSIVWRDWDVTPRYSSTYQFYPDSLVLLQRWTQGWYPRHIYKYKFNDIGELVEEEHTADNGRPIMYMSYEYDEGKMKIKDEKSFNDIGELVKESKTRLYYSSQSRLDSTVSAINSKDDGVYQMVTYYDSSGLKKQTVLMDTVTILYWHKKRSR